MVRTVKQVLRKEPPEIKIHHRSGACQPRDNLGIACLIQSESADDNLRCGRRRTLPIPKDNIGISCLPTSVSQGARYVPEESEYETSEEEQSTESSAKETKVAGKTKEYRLPKNDQGFVKHRTAKINENCPVRLRGGKDQAWTSSSNSSTTDVTIEENAESHQKAIMCKTTPVARMKNGQDIGISNIRRPIHDPNKPRKAIMPRDNLEATCRYIQKPVGRSCVRTVNGIPNKKNPNGTERMDAVEKIAPPPREKIVVDHTETLKSNPSQTKCGNAKADAEEK